MAISNKFYVYIIQSKKDGSYYIGQCDDLDRRMSKHFDGLSKYSASRRPWRLVYFEIFTSRTEALSREKYIKKMKSRIYIERLIHNWIYKSSVEEVPTLSIISIVHGDDFLIT